MAQPDTVGNIEQTNAANAKAASPYWSLPTDELLHTFDTSTQGLSAADAQVRLARVGPNAMKQHRRSSALVAVAALCRQ